MGTAGVGTHVTLATCCGGVSNMETAGVGTHVTLATCFGGYVMLRPLLAHTTAFLLLPLWGYALESRQPLSASATGLHATVTAPGRGFRAVLGGIGVGGWGEGALAGIGRSVGAKRKAKYAMTEFSKPQSTKRQPLDSLRVMNPLAIEVDVCLSMLTFSGYACLDTANAGNSAQSFAVERPFIKEYFQKKSCWWN